MHALNIDHLTLRLGNQTILRDVTLEISAGERVAIVGPNGSGKSTTILMLLGLTEPSEGRSRVCGFDPTREPLAVKRQVGYLPENVGFYGDLTGRENLQYTANLNAMPRLDAQKEVNRLLEMVELGGAKDQLVGQYS